MWLGSCTESFAVRDSLAGRVVVHGVSRRCSLCLRAERKQMMCYSLSTYEVKATCHSVDC
jgi:hypothetical protein